MQKSEGEERELVDVGESEMRLHRVGLSIT